MTNQNQSEVEMWWADLDECPEEDDISVGTLLRKHPRQGPLKWQESLFPVVRKSDYDKLKEENRRLSDVLSRTLNYLHWNADNLSGDDLVGDGRLTRRYKEVIKDIEDLLKSNNSGTPSSSNSPEVPDSSI